MTALDLGDGKITHRQQIVQLLKMAVAQEWQFSYLTVVKKSVNSNPVKLISVNLKEGTFSVDRELSIPDQAVKEPIMFRGQSGGISVVFKSRGNSNTESVADNNARFKYQLDLPYEVSCTQLRMSVRVDADMLPEEVPVVLYLAMGVQLDGTLADISTTGAKFVVKHDQTDKLKNLQVLDACKINLPEELVLKTGAQLLGVTYEDKRDASLLRCQFVDMKSQDEQALEKFIHSILEQMNSADSDSAP